MRQLGEITRNAVAVDLLHWKPSVVIVPRCHEFLCEEMNTLIDLVQWFNQDRLFATAWADYQLAGRIGPYQLWCRQSADLLCRKILGERWEPLTIGEK